MDGFAIASISIDRTGKILHGVSRSKVCSGPLHLVFILLALLGIPGRTWLCPERYDLFSMEYHVAQIRSNSISCI
jgi:hypothetical protein